MVMVSYYLECKERTEKRERGELKISECIFTYLAPYDVTNAGWVASGSLGCDKFKNDLHIQNLVNRLSNQPH